MEITVVQAMEMLPAAINLAGKLTSIIKTQTSMSVEEEVKALEAARMRPSEEVIKEAEKQA